MFQNPAMANQRNENKLSTGKVAFRANLTPLNSDVYHNESSVKFGNAKLMEDLAKATTKPENYTSKEINDVRKRINGILSDLEKEDDSQLRLACVALMKVDTWYPFRVNTWNLFAKLQGDHENMEKLPTKALNRAWKFKNVFDTSVVTRQEFERLLLMQEKAEKGNSKRPDQEVLKDFDETLEEYGNPILRSSLLEEYPEVTGKIV